MFYILELFFLIKAHILFYMHLLTLPFLSLRKEGGEEKDKRGKVLK